LPELGCVTAHNDPENRVLAAGCNDTMVTSFAHTCELVDIGDTGHQPLEFH